MLDDVGHSGKAQENNIDDKRYPEWLLESTDSQDEQGGRKLHEEYSWIQHHLGNKDELKGSRNVSEVEAVDMLAEAVDYCGKTKTVVEQTDELFA